MNYKQKQILKNSLGISIPVVILTLIFWIISFFTISVKEIKESKVIQHQGKTIIKISRWEYMKRGDTFINLISGKILEPKNMVENDQSRINKLKACIRYHQLDEYRGLWEKKAAELEAKEKELEEREKQIKSKLEQK
jgi:hypothetical protein